MGEIKKVLLFCLFFILLYNLFFFRTDLGLGFGLIILLINTYFLLVRNPANKNLNLAISASLISTFFAFLFSFRSNEIIIFLDFILSIFFLIISLYLYKLDEPFTSKLPDFLWIPAATFLQSVRSLPAVKGVNPHFWRGLLIAIPTFFILLLLLMNADPIFGKFASDFISTAGERTVTSAVIFTVIFVLGLTKLKNIIAKKNALEVSSGKVHELSVILASIALLFASFITIQFKYLFSGVSEGELAQLGIKSLTFSEYVNKGFFELLIVATITCLIIIYTLRFIHKFKAKQQQLIQILSSLVAFETLLILLSDVKRLMLYTDAHGLTRARIFGFVFLVWLTLFIVLLIFRIYKDLGEKWFLTGVLTLSLVIFSVINLINIDGLIATKYKPTVNGEIDYFYLTNISYDAAASWEPALKEMTAQINTLEAIEKLSTEDYRKLNWARMTIVNLNNKIAYLQANYADIKWQSLNFSEYSAFNLANKNKDFNTLENLLQRINSIDSRVDPAIKRNGPILDRSINPPF